MDTKWSAILYMPSTSWGMTESISHACRHAAVVDQYIQAQADKEYMAGPFPSAECTNIITSSIVVIPKKDPGKFRIIIDMSSPKNASVINGICRPITNVAYSSVEDAAHIMRHFGNNAQLAKIDVNEAYRIIISIHSEDQPFVGLRRRDQVYIDWQLPFSLASTPAIFSALGEALEWVLCQCGVQVVMPTWTTSYL